MLVSGRVSHQRIFRFSHLEAENLSIYQGDLPETPKDMGPPYGKRDPYYSHTIPISLGILMGVVCWYGNNMGSLP